MMLLLGCVANAWANIEDHMCTVFLHLAEVDEETAQIIFYTPSSFRGRLQIILNLVRHKLPDGTTRDALVGVLDKLNRLNGTRNNLVHAHYGFTFYLDRHPSIGRTNIRPNTKIIKSEVDIKRNEMETHLIKLTEIAQFFHFLIGSHFGDTVSLRRYADMILNTSAATSS